LFCKISQDVGLGVGVCVWGGGGVG